MSSSRGITWIEVLVALAIVSVALLALPMVHSPGKCRMTQVLSNMKQLHLATQQLTLDNEINNSPVRWTCSNTVPLSYGRWTNLLVTGNYLSDKDLRKLLSVTEEGQFWGRRKIDDAFTVFTVTESDPADTLLFATRNWHGPGSTILSGEPYGTRGFAVFYKGGHGMILLPRQITNASVIGTGGQYNFLRLK